MSNLKIINSALILYSAENNGNWPWIAKVTSDPSVVVTSTNRNRSPLKDPNAPGERSITALMFLLIRQDQPPGMFRCPDDKDATRDYAYKATEKDGDVLEGEYYWDFSKPENVSYSWQAPIWVRGRFEVGLPKQPKEEWIEPNAVICADMTPPAKVIGWKPVDVSKLSDNAIMNQNSPNHQGNRTNIVRVDGRVEAANRPDVGVDKDNVYTVSGDPNAGSRSATSLDIRKHLSTRDTFLIGPVGRKAE
jgi:hypothetical protein